jgi:predicted nucleic acid-binding protein
LIFLLDTCVLSEATKPRKHSGVMSWLGAQDMERQYVSAVTIGELHFGAERLPDGRKRHQLRDWIATVEEDYVGRIVPLDPAVAAHWGRLRAQSPGAQTVDAQLAATALAYGFTFVTRNVNHFRFDGLSVINPWDG